MTDLPTRTPRADPAPSPRSPERAGPGPRLLRPRRDPQRHPRRRRPTTAAARRSGPAAPSTGRARWLWTPTGSRGRRAAPSPCLPPSRPPRGTARRPIPSGRPIRASATGPGQPATGRGAVPSRHRPGRRRIGGRRRPGYRHPHRPGPRRPGPHRLWGTHRAGPRRPGPHRLWGTHRAGPRRSGPHRLRGSGAPDRPAHGRGDAAGRPASGECPEQPRADCPFRRPGPLPARPRIARRDPAIPAQH
ncbi:transcriptional regulator, Fis family [Nakamurella multipartita DSM 44233]|uniref:Transcriptional regulator, Fis family n=1 Tax=Nakamurella multipartita (strain ATCC 700099 / DSM 44233 / CIP 104796 / JCM 9543 / NBRC 105858 / Y-104) TaxID=479431 RepID=C8XBK0_NAKMY|nr:transcriptional regulator, Fis family [Nakamurella multipartita DSM 44233]